MTSRLAGVGPAALLRGVVIGKESRAMRVLTAAEGGSRLLSLLFYIVAARALSPAGFGVVRYTITFALILFLAMQVLVSAIARELGAARGDAERTRSVLGSSLLVAGGMLVVSWIACVATAAAGLSGVAPAGSLILVLTGQASFQLYYAMSRGLGYHVRPALTYFGASLVQLLGLLVYKALAHPDPGTTLAIFGLSSLLPIAVWELFRPVLFRQGLRVRRDALQLLWITAFPLIAGQISYVVWNSADQVWVQQQLGAHEIGLYGAARNLAQLFLVLPFGIGAALLPRVAELRCQGDGAKARRLVGGALATVVGISTVLGVMVILARGFLLTGLYGDGYRAADASLVALTVAMILASAYFVLSSASIGWGRGRFSALGFAAGALAEVAALLVVGPTEPAGAAWCLAFGSGVSCAVMALSFALPRWPRR